ncbi:MAG: pilus assembly protein PilM [Elusimicrobiota bacterium]
MPKLDELVEQLAFGAEPGKGAACLGLYLGPDVVYLSETHLKDGKLVVDHMVRIPIPADGKGPGSTATMNADFLADPTKIAGLVRQSMSQLRWNTKNVRVTLSHHLGLLRYFAMPSVDRRFLRSAVPLEAKKYIPIPFDILAHDYAAAPLPPDAGGKQRLGVLIAVTQKKNIANITGLLALLGLNLVGLEVAPCSVLRMWQAVDPQKTGAAYAHVHIDGGSVRIMVVDRDVPLFFREVFLGQDAGLSDLRKIDLSGCLSFVQKQLGLAGVTKLLVSGNLPDLSRLADAFAAETGLTATIQDTTKLLSVKSADWGGFASLGASTPLPESAPRPLDLAAFGRVTDDERQTARDILIAGSLAALFFAGAGLLNMATYAFHARELYRYQKKIDPQISSELSPLTSGAIDSLLKEMQIQAKRLQAVLASHRRLTVSALLKEIIDSMPPQLWIDRLTIQNDVQGDKPFYLFLRCHVQDRSVSEEQRLAFEFKEALIKNPVIGRAFDVSMHLENITGTSNRPAADSAALAKLLEERTQFEIELKAKK